MKERAVSNPVSLHTMIERGSRCFLDNGLGHSKTFHAGCSIGNVYTKLFFRAQTRDNCLNSIDNSQINSIVSNVEQCAIGTGKTVPKNYREKRKIWPQNQVYM